MTTLTTNTRPPKWTIRTSSFTNRVYESSNAGETNQGTFLQLRGLKGSAHEDSPVQEPPDRYITSVEYPLLAELWDNDADSVYDEL